MISFKMKLTVNVAHNTCLLLFSFMTHSIFNFSEVKRPFLTANNVEMKSSVFLLAISVVIFRFVLFCSDPNLKWLDHGAHKTNSDTFVKNSYQTYIDIKRALKANSLSLRTFGFSKLTGQEKTKCYLSMAKHTRHSEAKQTSASFSTTSLSSIASPASFSINVSSVNSAAASQMHSVSEDARADGAGQHCPGGPGGLAAREARSLQRRLMASNDIHEAFKFTQLMVS